MQSITVMDSVFGAEDELKKADRQSSLRRNEIYESSMHNMCSKTLLLTLQVLLSLLIVQFDEANEYQ